MNPNIWQKCIAQLEKELDERELHLWIYPLFCEYTDDHIAIFTPNHFAANWITNNYLHRITEVISMELASPNLSVTVSAGKTKNGDQPVHKPVFQPPSNSGEIKPSIECTLFREYTFASFICNKPNQLAHSAMLQAIAEPGQRYNPLVIYGDTGLGKSHLMHTFGHEVLKTSPDTKIACLASDRYIQLQRQAKQGGCIDRFKSDYQSVDVLLLDDIHSFGITKSSQTVLFETLNTLLNMNKQIIITCDRYPGELLGLEQRIKSLLNQGLTVVIERPSLADRIEILKYKANHRSIALSSDVALFIAQRITSNVRELEWALRSIYIDRQTTGQTVSLASAKKSLNAFSSKLGTPHH